MKDHRKTKAQLIAEIQELHERVAELEITKAELLEELEALQRRGVEPETAQGERKRKREHLQLLSSVVEQSSDSVIITNMSYKIVYVNRAFQKLYGYFAEELVGQSPEILNAEPNIENIQQEIYRRVSSGGYWKGVLRNRKKDGSTFPCELTVFPLADGTGKVFAFVGIQSEVTQQRRAGPTA
jgi:PAS domain S-box-containing protein